MILIFSLGSWWLFLVFKLSNLGQSINHLGDSKILSMLVWEGLSFFILTTLLGCSLFYLYFRDLKKNNALQAFFASLTHELKTPLASMRLQAEVIKDLIEAEDHSHEKLALLTSRLISDTSKLEFEIDKSFQLSRIEQGGNLSLSSLNPIRFLDHFLKRWEPQFDFQVINQTGNNVALLVDQRALEMILKNLIENTQRHQPDSRSITITLKRNDNLLEIIYDDFGKPFYGNQQRLKKLFYKYNSSKGSGVGLYIIDELTKKMNGTFDIEQKGHLIFKLTFPCQREEDHE